MNKNKREVLKEFEGIPGVGKRISRGLWDLGLRAAKDLKSKNPEELYERLCKLRRAKVDRCMLYVLRCAHYYASKRKHEKRLLKWWNWKDIDIEKYAFRDYDPSYKKSFLKEKKKLQKILGPMAVIEHVGSTAVPGLGGKGIIDIATGVSDLKKAKEKLAKSYKHRANASTRERLFFRKGYPPQVHIHLVKFNSRDWKEMIAFREYLRKNPKVALKYERIKKKSFEKAKGNGKAYRKYKDAFVEKIIAEAMKN